MRSRSTTALIGWTRPNATDPTKSLRWRVCRTQDVVSQPAVLTIGILHSRSTNSFACSPPMASIVAIDSRTIPRSRHNPQFSRVPLPRILRRAGIRYTHIPALGGSRHPRRDSPKTGWRNAGFRGYCDYMQTAPFRRSLDRCVDLAKGSRVVLMCAAAVPPRCHRSLVADALIVRGSAVSEIASGVRARPDSVTPWAGGRRNREYISWLDRCT